MITLKKTKSIQSSFQETKELALSLDSVDVFSSEDERKFAYLKIKNNRYSTCFFFVLKIDEYSASGTLLREGKLFFPNIYLPNGDTIENEYPFELDGDTESISICLVYAEYDGVHYYKDKLSSVLTKEMILETRALSACKDVKKELKEKTSELVDEPVPETEPEDNHPATDNVEEQKAEIVNEEANASEEVAPAPEAEVEQEVKEEAVISKEDKAILEQIDAPSETEPEEIAVAEPIISNSQLLISVFGFILLIATLAIVAYSLYSKANELSEYYFINHRVR